MLTDTNPETHNDAAENGTAEYWNNLQEENIWKYQEESVSNSIDIMQEISEDIVNELENEEQ